ncbi:MAG: hypothetical protein KAU21_07405, partial [Gammaproteobacteria bacterium]|nr:hypothetical protein [Gammaproteobacteria bacterium]
AVMLLGVSTFSFANTDIEVGEYPANITRTAWEVIRSDGVITLDSNLTSRDDVAAYDFVESPLPLLGDNRWQLATDHELIGFAEVSRLNGTDGNNGCKSAVDYTYFQTVVNVPFGVEVSEFNINFSGIDDDARVSIYNSKHQGLLIPGGVDGSDISENADGYVHLDDHNQYPLGQDINLLSYVTSGENRIVVTQVDNCPATDLGNLLQSAVVTLDGIEVITAEPFLFQAVTSTEPDQQGIITILARIYGVAGDEIPTLEVVTSNSCEGGILGGDANGDGIADGNIFVYDDLILNDNSFNLLGGDFLDVHGDAFLKGAADNVDYNPLRDIYFAVRVKSASGAVVGALSSCVVAGPDNDSWVRAAPITLTGEVGADKSSGSVSGHIDIPGIARWYKFSI